MIGARSIIARFYSRRIWRPVKKKTSPYFVFLGSILVSFVSLRAVARKNGTLERPYIWGSAADFDGRGHHIRDFRPFHAVPCRSIKARRRLLALVVAYWRLWNDGTVWNGYKGYNDGQ